MASGHGERVGTLVRLSEGCAIKTVVARPLSLIVCWMICFHTVMTGNDAMVHAILLALVFSIAFAHTPVSVPARLGVALPYRRALYAALALLYAGLVIRLAGDATASGAAWRRDGALNELAIVGVVALAAFTVVRSRRIHAKHGPSVRRARVGSENAPKELTSA